MRVLNCNLFLTALGAAVLTACGGGGGDAPASTPAASTATFPVEAVFQSLINQPQTFNLATTYQGKSATIAYTSTPGSNASFEGATRRTVQQVLTLRIDGVVAGTRTDTRYYDLSAAKAIGGVSSDGTYTVDTMSGAVPVSATVGMQWGGWTSITYANSSKATKLGDGVLNWSLDADTASTAWLCANSVDSSTNGTRESSAECYKINTNGQILGVKGTLMVQGETLTFQ